MRVRSQDKETSIEINGYNIWEGSNKRYKIVGFHTSNSNPTYFTLGYYETKEKAFKVLKMLEDKEIAIDRAKFMGCENEYYEPCIFEMPQDNEVED